jgi:hypothetical protein
MSAQVGAGLLRDFVMMLGGAMGIGLPMAAATLSHAMISLAI